MKFAKLQDFMLSNDLYNNCTLKLTKDEFAINKTPKFSESKKDTLIKIRDEDKLFWYYYIIKYDINEYNNNNKSKFQVEKKEKITNIELMRKDPNILKKFNITKNAYENNLLNESKISFETFMAMIAYNNLNVYYVKKFTHP